MNDDASYTIIWVAEERGRMLKSEQVGAADNRVEIKEESRAVAAVDRHDQTVAVPWDVDGNSLPADDAKGIQTDEALSTMIQTC